MYSNKPCPHVDQKAMPSLSYRWLSDLYSTLNPS